MKEKILITGASGFAGKSLAKYLKKKKFITTGIGFKNKKSIKIDLTKKIFLRKKFDWIVHTAAHHKIKDFNIHPIKKGKRNILMVKNLIDFAKQNEIKKFIYFSTIDLNYSPHPQKKKIYCASKIHGEKILLNALRKKFFNKLIILRLPAIVGSNGGDNFVKKTIFNLKKNLPVNIWNMNTKYNNLIHINDLNRLIYYYFFKKNNKIIIDCLSSNPIRLKYLINYLKKKLKSKSKINFMYKKNKYKRINFNSKVKYKFFSVKKTINLLI